MSLLRRIELALAGGKDMPEGAGEGGRDREAAAEQMSEGAADGASERNAGAAGHGAGADLSAGRSVQAERARVSPGAGHAVQADRPALAGSTVGATTAARWVDPHVSGVYVLWKHQARPGGARGVSGRSDRDSRAASPGAAAAGEPGEGRRTEVSQGVNGRASQVTGGAGADASGHVETDMFRASRARRVEGSASARVVGAVDRRADDVASVREVGAFDRRAAERGVNGRLTDPRGSVGIERARREHSGAREVGVSAGGPALEVGALAPAGIGPVSADMSAGIGPVSADMAIGSDPVPVDMSAGFRREATRWRAGAAGPAPLRGRPLALPGSSAWREALGWLSTHAPELAEGATFLDIETTGLGHTAGTLAFVVGLARVVAGAVEVEQYVLQNMSGEPAMLAAIAGRLPPGGLLVTFNGASFDLPVLRGRLRRCGLDPAGLGGPHLDLLPLARRLWRGRGPDCRLTTLERLQLGLEREGDLPGHAIPAMFWAALREPRAGAAGIRQVVAHNLADMLAMPALALALARTVARPTDLDLALRVADHLNAIGRRAAALAALSPWVAPLVALDRPGAGDPAGQLRERRALLRAAELHRREGRTDAAACLWEAVCRRFPGDPAAHAALSRDLERRRGDPAAALAVAAASEAPCPRRLARLQRMVQRTGPGTAGEALSSARGPC